MCVNRPVSRETRKQQSSVALSQGPAHTNSVAVTYCLFTYVLLHECRAEETLNGSLQNVLNIHFYINVN